MKNSPAKEVQLLTSGNPARRIVLFALPFFAGDIFYTFYTIIDGFVLGRWLGINGLAAVGASSSFIWLVYGFCYGLTDGFAVITAQRVGAGNDERIRSSVAAAVSLCFFVSIILTCLLLPLVRPVLSLMMTPAEIMDDSSVYVLVTFSGICFVLFGNMLAGIIRAGGNSFSPMLFYMIGTLCKILLDILFVVVLPWGIRGAALSTVLADLIAMLLFLGFLIRRFPRFLPRRQDWHPNLGEYGTHFYLGISMAFMRSIIEVGNILLQAAINGLGALTIAAVSAAQRVRGLSIIPLFSVYRATITYTAQNYGAGKIDRINRGLFQVCLINLGLGLFMAILNHLTGGPIVSLFLKDSPEAAALATQYILISGYTVFILGIMLAFRSTMQGLGMKSASMLCGTMETAMSVLAAFVLIPRIGFTGACLASPLAWVASGIPLYIAFGIWKGRN